MVDSMVIALEPDPNASNSLSIKLMANDEPVGYFSNEASAIRELDKIAAWLDSQGSYTIYKLFDPFEERKIIANNIYQVEEET